MRKIKLPVLHFRNQFMKLLFATIHIQKPIKSKTLVTTNKENGLYGMYIRVKSLHKYVCACNFAQHPSRHSPNFHPSTMIICVKELAVLAAYLDMDIVEYSKCAG